jgi:hypothetical protein
LGHHTRKKERSAKEASEHLFWGPSCVYVLSSFIFVYFFVSLSLDQVEIKKEKRDREGFTCTGGTQGKEKKKGSPPRITRLDNVPQYIRKTPPTSLKGG